MSLLSRTPVSYRSCRFCSFYHIPLDILTDRTALRSCSNPTNALLHGGSAGFVSVSPNHTCSRFNIDVKKVIAYEIP